MQARDFVFWLNGFFELGGGAEGLTKDQVETIKTHLALVFVHDDSVKQGVGTHPVPQKNDISDAFDRYRQQIIC